MPVADSTYRKPSSTAPSLPLKGGPGVGKTKRGKGTKILAAPDSAGLPVAVCAESATPHEVTLVQQTLAEIRSRGRCLKSGGRPIGDVAAFYLGLFPDDFP